VKGALLLLAFVAGAVVTWLLTVHRVSREVDPGASGPSDDADFGGTRSAESSGTAGARWMGDAEDEDALLADADDTGARRRPPPAD